MESSGAVAMRRRARSLAGHALTSAFVVSCGDGDLVGLAPDEGTGTLAVALTDAPVDFATQVVIEVTGVEITPDGGGEPLLFAIEPERAVELLALRNGASVPVVQGWEVPAGRYESLRLIVDARPDVLDGSFIELETGERFPLFVPAGSEAGLTVAREFVVAENGRVDLVVDLDLRKSMTGPAGPGQSFELIPVLRVADAAIAGAIAGTVEDALLPVDCTPFVYVFAGGNALPDDMDPGGDGDPVTSVPAAPGGPGGRLAYRASFLDPGDYTVAFTCEGALDSPDADEALFFPSAVSATVSPNQTTIVDF